MTAPLTIFYNAAVKAYDVPAEKVFGSNRVIHIFCFDEGLKELAHVPRHE